HVLADNTAMPVPEIEAEARAAGLLGARQPLSQCRPLRDARLALRLKVIREGFGEGGRWLWAREDYKTEEQIRETRARASQKQQQRKQKQQLKRKQRLEAKQRARAAARAARTSMENRTSMADTTSTVETTSMGN